MSSQSDLSLEVGHLYLDKMTEDSVKQAVTQAKPWVQPILEKHGWKVVSICVLLDNYNRLRDHSGGWTEQHAQAEVVRAFAEVGITIDHVVWEGSCADTVHHLKELIVEEPRFGAGSRRGAKEPPIYDESRGWLSNGDPPRSGRKEVRGGVLQRIEKPLTPPDPRFNHVIALDVQLWKEQEGCTRWACPAVAAWWQLIRLGALDQLGLPSVPAGTWSRVNAHPLQAKRTLTLLPSHYIEVEHAVMNILRQVALPDDWVRALKDSPDEPARRAQLDRIGYIFVPDGFTPTIRLRAHGK